MTKAWRNLGALGFITALAMSGCVITSGDDDDTGGTGGTTSGGSGGTTGGTGGASGSGGTAGATGGTAGATGGAAGSGGSAGYVCAAQSPGGGTPALDCKDTENDTCQKCFETSCCTEFEACYMSNPNNPCGFGAPDGMGEINCMVDCVQKNLGTPAECAGTCTSPTCATIDPATSELWACLDQNCLVQCALN
jgi:hypothetical protein